MKLLAIDPSVNGTGIAAFEGGLLTAAIVWECDLRVEPEKFGEISKAFFEFSKGARFTAWDVLVCEVPEVYRNAPRPQDLLAVTMVAGALCTIPAKKVCTYLPKVWKGQVPKKIHHERLLTQINADERAILDAAKKEAGAGFHNAMDAVGIGLWYLQTNMGRKKHP